MIKHVRSLRKEVDEIPGFWEYIFEAITGCTPIKCDSNNNLKLCRDCSNKDKTNFKKNFFDKVN
jgi:hypothetical protein